MGLNHIKELLSGRRSSWLVPVVSDLVSVLVSDLVSDLVSGLEVTVVSVIRLAGPNLRRG